MAPGGQAHLRPRRSAVLGLQGGCLAKLRGGGGWRPPPATTDLGRGLEDLPDEAGGHWRLVHLWFAVAGRALTCLRGKHKQQWRIERRWWPQLQGSKTLNRVASDANVLTSRPHGSPIVKIYRGIGRFFQADGEQVKLSFRSAFQMVYATVLDQRATDRLALRNSSGEQAY